MTRNSKKHSMFSGVRADSCMLAKMVKAMNVLNILSYDLEVESAKAV